ncbi:ABC transporter [Clostridium peptidivorans]|uniref:ABC transporter n=1 Tax=Clostridium peptidivorans TaxID=100174 RepID=UPI000BE316FA|nr:ABC transporter [Clostridium peptidivorans]
MEYFNKGYGMDKGLFKILKILGFLFLTYFIIQGLFILIPVGILIYAGYRGIKFIQSKFKRFKKAENINEEAFEIYKDSNQYVYNSEVIDVEYEEVTK